jgi:hypothetical protein
MDSGPVWKGLFIYFLKKRLTIVRIMIFNQEYTSILLSALALVKVFAKKGK